MDLSLFQLHPKLDTTLFCSSSKAHPPNATAQSRRQLQIQCLTSLFLENYWMDLMPGELLHPETSVSVPTTSTKLLSVCTIVTASLYLHPWPPLFSSRAESLKRLWIPLPSDSVEQVTRSSSLPPKQTEARASLSYQKSPPRTTSN